MPTVVAAVNVHVVSSMKFLSTWLRNACVLEDGSFTAVLNEVPEHMAQESRRQPECWRVEHVLNEVPEHMAQECRMCHADASFGHHPQ